MQRAFFAATLSFVRLSPSRKLHPQSLQQYRYLFATTSLLTIHFESHFLHVGIISQPLFLGRDIIPIMYSYVNTLKIFNEKAAMRNISIFF